MVIFFQKTLQNTLGTKIKVYCYLYCLVLFVGMKTVVGDYCIFITCLTLSDHDNQYTGFYYNTVCSTVNVCIKNKLWYMFRKFEKLC